MSKVDKKIVDAFASAITGNYESMKKSLDAGFDVNTVYQGTNLLITLLEYMPEKTTKERKEEYFKIVKLLIDCGIAPNFRKQPIDE